MVQTLIREVHSLTWVNTVAHLFFLNSVEQSHIGDHFAKKIYPNLLCKYGIYIYTYFSVSKATDGNLPDKEMSVTGGYFQSGKPGSAKEKRTLQSVKTHFYVGTEVCWRLV